MKIKSKALVLVAVVLLVSMSLSACGLNSTTSADYVSDAQRTEFINNTLIGDYEILYCPIDEAYKSIPAGYPKVSRANGSLNGLTDMYLLMENDKYGLYIDFETTDIAVMDKSNSNAFHSNPDRDPKTNLSSSQIQNIASPISLEAYDVTNKRYSFNFYGNCQEDGSFWVLKTGENSIRLIYTIGNDPDKDLFPPVITQNTYENVILPGLANAGLDAATYQSYLRTLENCYRFMSPDTIDLETRERFKETFPTIDVMTLYVSYAAVSTIQKRQVKEVLTAAGFTVEDLKREMELADYQGPERAVLYTIPLDLTLDENGLQVNLDSSLILGPSKQKLYSLALYRGMGANNAQIGTEYLIVPDGSGSIIPARGNVTVDAYKAQIYGSDETFNRFISLDSSQPVLSGVTVYDRGPISDSVKNGGGIMSVMEKGGGQCYVYGRPIAGTGNPVASAYYEVIYSERDYRVYSSATDATGSGLLLAKDRAVAQYQFRYLFTEGDMTYAEYAKFYRSYLQSTGVLPTETVENTTLPFYVDLLGAIDVNESVLGIPVSVKKALTTYTQAKEILQNLKDSGVDNVIARYSFWANGGYYNTVYNDLNLIGEMGSPAELSDLVEYVSSNNMGFFPSADFMYVYNDVIGDGFSVSEDAARRLNLSIASLSARNNATGVLLTAYEYASSKSILSPDVMPKFAETFRASFEKVVNHKQISLGNMGSSLNSSYKTNRNVSRAIATDFHVQVFNIFSDYDLMVEGGNDYSWKYASHILNMPLGSSQYLSSSGSIPFMQIVLHGYVNYTGSPMNEEADYETALLRCLETGSGIYFRWMGAEDTVFNYTEFFNYYSSHYMDTFDKAVKLYKEAAGVLNQVVNQPIENHEQANAYYVLDHEGLIGWLEPGDPGYQEDTPIPELTRVRVDGVFVTTYANGVTILVNYNDVDVELEDRTVLSARSYQVLTAEEYEKIATGSAYEALPEVPEDDPGTGDETENEEG